MRWQGRPSVPVLFVTTPALVELMQLKGMLPQMFVGRVPTAMRLRPYALPKELATANAGTRSSSTICELCWYVARKVHSRFLVLIGTRLSPPSKPRVDILPPLIVWLSNPELCGRGNVTSRSEIFRR